MNKLYKVLGFAAVMGSPLMALAQPVGGTPVDVGGPNAFSILAVIANIMNIIIPLLITAAVIYIIAGILKYVTASDGDKQAEGRTMIISGVVGLFVIVSIWGLVAILNSTFRIQQSGTATQVECIPGTLIGYENGQPIFCQE
ncbi:MAG: hypothetical protein QG580_401 [Patescibacteria group bacterium]|jgi:hypothetical protein|nr:hypothetical protein [Patescibacteria group bacterium]